MHYWVKFVEESTILGICEGIRTIGVAVMIKFVEFVISDGISMLNTAFSPFSMKTLVGVCKGSIYDVKITVRRKLSSKMLLDFIDIL